jgi:hypothetical protein
MIVWLEAREKENGVRSKLRKPFASTAFDIRILVRPVSLRFKYGQRSVKDCQADDFCAREAQSVTDAFPHEEQRMLLAHAS